MASTEDDQKSRRLEYAIEVLNYCCLTIVTAGVILVLVGYFVPRTYETDPEISARENERLSLAINHRAHIMDICVITGTVCIGIGGLIVLILLIRDLYKERPPPPTSGNTRMQPYYGTTVAEVGRPRTSVVKRNSVLPETEEASK